MHIRKILVSAIHIFTFWNSKKLDGWEMMVARELAREQFDRVVAPALPAVCVSTDGVVLVYSNMPDAYGRMLGGHQLEKPIDARATVLCQCFQRGPTPSPCSIM